MSQIAVFGNGIVNAVMRRRRTACLNSPSCEECSSAIRSTSSVDSLHNGSRITSPGGTSIGNRLSDLSTPNRLVFCSQTAANGLNVGGKRRISADAGIDANVYTENQFGRRQTLADTSRFGFLNRRSQVRLLPGVLGNLNWIRRSAIQNVAGLAEGTLLGNFGKAGHLWASFECEVNSCPRSRKTTLSSRFTTSAGRPSSM